MIRVAITHGDINGTGYEEILKAFEVESMLDICTPVIYGSPKVATYHRKAIGNQTNFIVRNNISEVKDHSVNMVNCFGEDEIKVELGQATAEKDSVAKKSIESALHDLKEGRTDVMVTAPCSFSNGKSQTAFIYSQLQSETLPLNILMTDRLRIVSATNNIPLSEVSGKISKELLAGKLKALETALQRDFCIERPRIAVLALNPKDGEGNFVGKEESEIIEPLVKEMFEAGTLCFGPYPADYIFSNGNYDHFDAILTMYADQGMAPFKALGGGDGVMYTACLPYIITAPAHDSQYAIAGKNTASPEALRNAIYSAIDALRNRRQYEKIHSNPLRKQYYDKRDDSDKLKLDQVNDDEDEVTLI